MVKSIIVVGKTKDEALNNALTELSATIDEVEVQVIEEGSRGFLGIGSRPFKLKVSKKSDPIKTAKDFLREVFVSIGISVNIECEFIDGKYLNIDLSGDNMGVLIGKRGQTLDSLQYITSIVVNKSEDTFININIDTEHYRNKRKETLENLAIGLAKKAKHLRKDVVLEPMNPNERRIIHAALQNDKYVTTHSEGEGSFRYIIISPKEPYSSREYSNYKSNFKSGFRKTYPHKDNNYRESVGRDSYKSNFKGTTFKNNYGSYRNTYKSDFKSDYKNDYKSDYKNLDFD